MNKILSILIFWITAVSALTAQTSLDSLVFKKINLYRSSLKLSQLRWNDTIYFGAEHHTDYLYHFNKKEIDVAIKNETLLDRFKSGHDEDIRLNEIENETFETRANKYNFNEECVTMFTGNMALKDETISDWIVNSWKRSPLHNKILTDPGIYQGAVSCKTVMISDVPEEEKKDNLKYGRDNKGILYFSSTFNCKK